MEKDRPVLGSNSKAWEHRTDLLIGLVLVLAVVALKLPVLNLPIYWDEMSAYVKPAMWLSERSLADALPGRHPDELFFGHPPLLYLLLAALYKIFVYSLAISHTLAVGFAALAVLFTYRVGSHLGGRWAGAGAATLLVSYPIYFAQAGMMLADVPLAALGILAFWYFLQGRDIPCVLVGTAMVLVKETGGLFVALLLVARLVGEREEEGNPWRIALFSLPLLVLAAFFLFQRQATGSFLPNPYFLSHGIMANSPTEFAFKVAFAGYWAFVAQGRIFLTVAIAVAVLRSRHQFNRGWGICLSIVAAYFVAFSGIYFIPRYLLIVAPIVSVLGASALRQLVPACRWYVVAVTLVALGMVFFPVLKKSGYDSFETTMQYQDVVGVFRDCGSFLDRDFSGCRVLAPWPLVEAYADSRFGYVRRPVPVTGEADGPWELAVVTPQSDKNATARIRARLARGDALLVRRFARNGKELEVYRRVPLGQ